MRVEIAAIGRLGRSPEAEAADEFLRRIDQLSGATRIGPIRVTEIVDKTNGGPAAEATLLLRRSAEVRVALDERGRQLRSADFAGRMRDWRDRGVGEICFMIGGADGHPESLRAGSDLVLSLGAMTWPHALARLMLVEQIYRAATIVAGHPYHREG